METQEESQALWEQAIFGSRRVVTRTDGAQLLCCITCQEPFTFSADEQRFFASMGNQEEGVDVWS